MTTERSPFIFIIFGFYSLIGTVKNNRTKTLTQLDSNYKSKTLFSITVAPALEAAGDFAIKLLQKPRQFF